ncbi:MULTISPECIES: adenosine kinase [Sphingomonas]|uniref:adenosine kinase n=1 Tax=Sphingomonas TaxID=13687 RepID=UPI000837521D|nr:adenosine kinase [Sphingomonas sp. CCH10-B3]
MTAPSHDPTLDVVAIGNAIVDVLAHADDDFIAAEGMTKGSMQLMFSPAEADALYAKMGPGTEASGGSAANTVAGIAALGGKTGFIGQVAKDQLGEVFAHDIRATGVVFDTPARDGEPSTARCLILVTPDGQRTMNTFLGASQFLPAHALDRSLIESGAILYLEGYLWDPEEPRAAMRAAIDFARAAGRKVAFTVSDVFCISRHGDDFRQLLADGLIDILFANENELLALANEEDFQQALLRIAAQVPLLVVTRSEKGALAIRTGETATVAAEPIERVVDTTGAGDLFAAGFLHGQARGMSLVDSLRIGAICAAEIISHVGARPMVDLKALVAEKLGAAVA